MFVDCVVFVHALIFAFMLIAPFSPNPKLPYLHVVFSFGILIHQAFNSNKCVFGLIEHLITGVPYDKTIIASILDPIFTPGQFTLGVLVLALISLGRCWWHFVLVPESSQQSKMLSEHPPTLTEEATYTHPTKGEKRSRQKTPVLAPEALDASSSEVQPPDLRVV